MCSLPLDLVEKKGGKGVSSFATSPSNNKKGVRRTEIQLAHDSDLLNGVVFRFDLIQHMAGGLVCDSGVQRRAPGEQQFGRHGEREKNWLG